jgi:hypothetical protein
MAWDGSLASTTLVSSGSALSNDTISAVSSEFDNSSTLDTMGVLEIAGTFGTAPSDTSPTLDIYYTIAPDGTNYSDAPLTGGADQSQTFLVSIPVRKINTAQRLSSIMLPLPGAKLKFYVDNQTGQSLNSTWALKIFTASV